VKRMAAFSVEPVGSTPEAYAVLIRADFDRYGKVVKLTGARAD
jgi:hypothetical protein